MKIQENPKYNSQELELRVNLTFDFDIWQTFKLSCVIRICAPLQHFPARQTFSLNSGPSLCSAVHLWKYESVNKTGFGGQTGSKNRPWTAGKLGLSICSHAWLVLFKIWNLNEAKKREMHELTVKQNILCQEMEFYWVSTLLQQPLK